ncbi:porin [Dyadobacter flavalbus]|uniref:Porin n=1 Tax=Dyadobacter flavalbus TaxID=2579942 RepID=A0A5M8QT75_9BACT|nr:porin [Dyadobacter flavalbus]KAA6439329.1 porin [Dyadobacter flavalbus]
MKTLISSAVSLMILQPALAQDATATKNPLTVSGYVEAYYNHDFNRPENNTVPGFLYNFNRAGEVNLNLAFIKAAYVTDRVRANVALAAGTYMNANYNAEPGVLRNILEANAGIKLSRTHTLWLDAGIMPSHIGFESAVGKDNWTLSRSLLAENSPYFEAGLKLGFTTRDEKLYLSAMYLNGWQRIQRIDGNSTPGFGTQVTYKPNDAVTLNYSTFIGNDKPDSLRQMRYFHNVYGIFRLTSRLGITAGFDIGTEQKAKGSSRFNSWYTPVLIARFSVSEKIRMAARGEYYADRNGVIISTGTANGFKTYGYSLNFDCLPADNVVWRMEARCLNSKDAIFTHDHTARNQNYFVTTSVALSF